MIIVADLKSLSRKGKMCGHAYPVAKNYVDLYGNECEVRIAGGPVFGTRFSENELFKLPYDSVEGESGWKNKVRTLLNCRYLFRKSQPEDKIIIQQNGASTVFLGIALFARESNQLYVIQYNTDSISSTVGRWIYKLAKSRIKGFICPSSRILDAYDKPGCVVTDFIYPGNDFADKMPNYHQKKYDFSMVGGIYEDKGVVEVAEKLANTSHRVLIAGKPSNPQLHERLRQIASAAPNITMILDFIDDADYYRYIRESRYCILNYRGCYMDRSSGIVLDILFNGAPVIGHRCSALQFVEEEGVGLLYENLDDMDFNKALNEELYEKFQNRIASFLIKQQTLKEYFLNYIINS